MLARVDAPFSMSYQRGMLYVRADRETIEKVGNLINETVQGECALGDHGVVERHRF